MISTANWLFVMRRAVAHSGMLWCCWVPRELAKHIQYLNSSKDTLTNNHGVRSTGRQTNWATVNRATNQPGDNQLGDTFRSTGRQYPHRNLIWCIFFMCWLLLITEMG